MRRINLMRTPDALNGVLRQPRCNDLRAQANTSPRVQLWRVIGSRRVRAPMVHRVGYLAGPGVAAPLCSEAGGPYGRVVWIRIDRDTLGSVGGQRIRRCGECEARAGIGRVYNPSRAMHFANEAPLGPETT